MELWIRSQDKLDLIKCTSIHIERTPGVDEVAIKTFNYGDKYTYVGYYETKERAIEILTDIQRIIHLKDMYINDRDEVLKAWTKFTEEQIGDVRTKMSVYEMPQE